MNSAQGRAARRKSLLVYKDHVDKQKPPVWKKKTTESQHENYISGATVYICFDASISGLVIITDGETNSDCTSKL